jgi:hypothetical protein
MKATLLQIALVVIATLFGVLLRFRGNLRRGLRLKMDEKQRLVKKQVVERLERVLD